MKLLQCLLLILNEVISFEQNHFTHGVKVIPHPDKVAKGGEDSYYANLQILSVADGVGGWNSKGIDPAKYSRELSSNIENKFSSQMIKKPKLLLTEASVLTKNKGSSTLVILTMDQRDSIIHSAYMGDSGYLILRRDQSNQQKLTLVYESEEQQHSFNYPFQLGNPGDDPVHALEFTHAVLNGDIIILGSDGLFDNLDSKMILELMEEQLLLNNTINHQLDADLLGQRAFEFSLNKKYNSPFAQRAKQQGKRYNGGKSDDITVIVATVNLVQELKEDI